jgi:hypothetical protein
MDGFNAFPTCGLLSRMRAHPFSTTMLTCGLSERAFMTSLPTKLGGRMDEALMQALDGL